MFVFDRERPSSTKTYAGIELHHVAVNLDFTGDGSTNAIAYNKLVFGGLSNGLLAYNCALNIGNCRCDSCYPFLMQLLGLSVKLY